MAVPDVVAQPAKHSSGPWIAGHMADDTHSCNCRYILNGDYMGSIAVVSVDNGIDLISEGGNDCPPLEEAKANARLIAAAPELLEALAALSEAARAYLAHMDLEDILALEGARAAIAKATGAPQ